jgi:hypothetical protein
VPHLAWLGYGFALVMVAVSLYCGGRLVVARRWNRPSHYDVNVSHVMMGLAMAGMFVPRWNLLPDRIWIVAFGLLALWFLALSARFVFKHGLGGSDDGHAHLVSHDLTHLVMACIMLYMYWAATRTGPSINGMAMGSATAAQPSYLVLSFLFVMILFASAIWQLDAISTFSHRRLAIATALGASAGSDGEGERGQGRTGALTGTGRSLAGAAQPSWMAPRLEMACHVCMCVAMGYMLVVML